MQSTRRRTFALKLTIALALSTSVGLPKSTVAAPTIDAQTQSRPDTNTKTIDSGTVRTNIRLTLPTKKPQRTPATEQAPQEQPGFSVNAGDTFRIIATYTRYIESDDGTLIPVADSVNSTASSEPEIPGATYSFDPNPVQTSSPQIIAIDTALESTPGVYTVTIQGISATDGFTYTPASFQLTVKPQIAPTVFDPTIWWFNLPLGQPQQDGYPTQLPLIATPGAASYQWEIVSGTDKAAFSNGASTITTTSNSVDVYSIGPSAPQTPNDVAVQVTANSVASDEFRFTIKAPYKLIFLSYSNTVPNATQPWQTYVNYEVQDQFDQPLPQPISWNEFFTTDTINDIPNNWNRGQPGAATQNPGALTDRMNSPQLDPRITPTPILYNRAAPSPIKVLHFDGEWRVGTLTPGTGRRVQKNRWQFWLDRGTHENRISPYP